MIHRYPVTVTTAGGSASTTIRTKHTDVRQIIIEPATADTSFDFSITDAYHGFTQFEAEDWEGNSRENNPGFSTFYNIVLNIDNASRDEDFDILIVAKEVI